MATNQEALQSSGYDCSFVSPLPSDLQSECAICLYILREPFLVGCCGYRFCRSCIEPIQNKRYGRRCPLCNQKNFSSLPDKQLERILNEKLVYCAHKYDGCDWFGRLSEVDTHLNPPGKKRGGCLYRKVKCYHCGDLVYAINIGEHARGCRLVACTYCKTYEDTAHKMDMHYDECPMYPVLCPNDCGAKPFRKNIWRHVNESCPLTVFDCPYRYTGCNARITRRELSSHDDAEDHLALAEVKIKELEAENSSLKAQLRSKGNMWSSYFQPPSRRSIRYLHVTNLPPSASYYNLKSMFGQHGSVEEIEMHGRHFAKVTYEDETSALAALSHSEEYGINLKSFQLKVDPVY